MFPYICSLPGNQTVEASLVITGTQQFMLYMYFIDFNWLQGLFVQTFRSDAMGFLDSVGVFTTFRSVIPIHT